MIKIYCIVCYKYRKFKNPKISYILKKHYVFQLFAVSVAMNVKNQESFEILTILSLINGL